MSAAATANIIEHGDFIQSSTIRTVTGFVLRRRILGNRKRPLAGWTIRMGNGKEDFIEDAAAVLIAKSDDWWERFEAEHAQPAIGK